MNKSISEAYASPPHTRYVAIFKSPNVFLIPKEPDRRKIAVKPRLIAAQLKELTEDEEKAMGICDEIVAMLGRNYFTVHFAGILAIIKKDLFDVQRTEKSYVDAILRSMDRVYSKESKESLAFLNCMHFANPDWVRGREISSDAEANRGKYLLVEDFLRGTSMSPKMLAKKEQEISKLEFYENFIVAGNKVRLNVRINPAGYIE